MRMLRAVLANLFAPARTRAPDDRPPVPPALRGRLAHVADLCTGCGTCAHVCAPGAIELRRDAAGEPQAWTWFSGACSYCGLCSIWCPTRAISTVADPQAAAGRGEQLRLEDPIAHVRCSRCGRLHVPLPEALQAEALRGDLVGTARDEKDLCEDCRRRMTSERMRGGFAGPSAFAARAADGPRPEVKECAR
jgi:hydrogenase-4 component H